MLNLTAMLDVMFLLIIFFVLNTKFLDDERQINLQVPQVTDQGKLRPPPSKRPSTSIATARITLDGANVTLPELPARLARPAAKSKNLGVLVRGDGHGELQQVADVLAACKQAGISDLAVSVRLATMRK